MKHLTLITSLLVFVVVSMGCASRGYNRADRAASSLQSAAARVDLGVVQIDNALAALTALTDNPSADLKPQFSRFNSAVSSLESLSKDLAGKSEAMQKKGTNYFVKWDEELARIQSEDIRNRSAARKAEVVQGFQRVQANYQNASVVLAPFIGRLLDIRMALGTDLTQAGLDSIRGSASSVTTEGGAVAQSLRNLSADFKSLGGSLSTSVPQPPAQPATQTTSPSVGN